ncbi:MAG: CPBP family intramembrane glutamic endopeptidase [Parvularculaceae bacterium]
MDLKNLAGALRLDVAVGRGRDFFLENRVGRWRWPFALLGALVFIVLMIVLTAPLGFLMEEGDPDEFLAMRPGSLYGFISFATVGLSFLIPAALTLRLVHGQNPFAALGPGGRFGWGDFARGVGAAASLGAAGLVIAMIFSPEALKLAPKSPDYVLWFALAAAILLVQSFGEEYFFKGYLARVWGAIVPYRFIIVPALSAIFASVHAGNPDVAADLYFSLLVTFMMAAFTYVIYLRTESLGAVTGLHWFNNLWAICIVATAPVQSEAMALAVYVDPVLSSGGSRLADPRAYLELALMFAVLWLLLASRRSPFYLAPRAATPPAGAALA